VKIVFHWFFRAGKVALLFLGSVALLGIILAFTSAPFWIWYGLGTANADITRTPDYIVVLGGSGIPSESGLMRTFYAGIAATHFPDALLIVALPGDTADSLSSISKMRDELFLRGIPPERILLEDSGTNTRAQAMLIRELVHNYELRMTNDEFNGDSLTLLLITSPEHLYRAVLVFRKAGFKNVDGLPAFESDIESDISFAAKRLGGRRWVPDVGDSITLRYQFWTQLQYEILILREYLAITYYWLMGWI